MKPLPFHSLIKILEQNTFKLFQLFNFDYIFDFYIYVCNI